jgi:ketosteroid isomerase-like protein
MILASAMSLMLAASACTPQAPPGAAAADTVEVRKAIEVVYAEYTRAFLNHDYDAILALRAPNFHAILPDGRVQDRAAMELYTRGFLNGVKQWNKIVFTVDSLRVVGDTAIAITSQYLDRMALRPDNAVHHVETWVTQRETFTHVNGRWLFWRVDQLRNQRRHVDGQPG